MSEAHPGEMTTDYKCSICHKGFDNRRSCIRHVSYCRSKSRNPPRSRRKACLDCSKAKTHCDAGFPACSRCLDKNISCRYQNQYYQLPQAPADLLSFTPSSSSVLRPDSFMDDSTLCPSQYAETIDFDFETMGSLFMDERLHGFLDIYQPAPRSPRLFWPKEAHPQELSLNRKYVLVKLRSYPRMILASSRNGMPPFIHSYHHHRSQDCTNDTSLPEPLARCAGIVAMWSVKSKHNSMHIWKAIRSEQERLLQECSEYNDWDAVAALQALCVYVILRVLEEDEDVTDFDIPLIHTVVVCKKKGSDNSLVLSQLIIARQKVGRHVGEPDARHCKPSSIENPVPRWESWILDESARRTMFIIFIVISLFDASAGLDYKTCGCAEYLLSLALPSTKSMWNSRTGTEWEQEYMGSPVQSDFWGKSNQVLTFGDLLPQQNEGVECSNSAAGGSMLDQWLARVDEAGTLVMSAAKFSEYTFYR